MRIWGYMPQPGFCTCLPFLQGLDTPAFPVGSHISGGESLGLLFLAEPLRQNPSHTTVNVYVSQLLFLALLLVLRVQIWPLCLQLPGALVPACLSPSVTLTCVSQEGLVSALCLSYSLTALL